MGIKRAYSKQDTEASSSLRDSSHKRSCLYPDILLIMLLGYILSLWGTVLHFLPVATSELLDPLLYIFSTSTLLLLISRF